MNPKFAHTLSGTIADERRHVGFGENRIGSLIAGIRRRSPTIERMQKEMSYYMLATFADAFRNNPAPDEFRRSSASAAAARTQRVGRASIWRRWSPRRWRRCWPTRC